MAGTRDLNAPGAGRISQSRFWATVLVLIALGIVGSWVVLSLYGAGSYLPGLVTGFLGTLVAFVLALTWERDREGRQLAREAKDLQDRRATELRRRLEPVRASSRRTRRACGFWPRHSRARSRPLLRRSASIGRQEFLSRS